MPRFAVVTMLVVAVALVLPTISAQSPAGRPMLGAGTRIRVSAAPPVAGMTGVVVSHSGDTLVFRSDADGRTVAIPTVQMTRLDVSEGTRTWKLRGATYGFLGGAAIGALIGYATYDKPPPCTGGLCLDPGSGVPAMLGALAGGPAGLIVGTAFGTRSTERWNTASRAGDVAARFGIAPAPRGGVALATSLTF